MNDNTLLAIAALSCMAFIGLIALFIIRSQQKTIERLNDRLMVLSGHKEYAVSKGAQSGRETEYTQLSWHDDPQPKREQ
jgi:hypothetical protein